MFFSKIYPYKAGLVFRNGNYVKTVTEGSHWLRWNDEVKEYDMTKPFNAPCDVNILLADFNFKNLVEVTEVKDNEIALQFRDGNFYQVLRPGRYLNWKSVVKYEHRLIDLNGLEVPTDIDRKILHRPEVIQFIRVHVVEAYEVGLLFVDGKFIKQIESGVFYTWKNEKGVAVMKADMRNQLMEVSGQEILTKDKAAVRVSVYVQYKITDVDKALVETKDVVKQLYVLMQLSLREYIGTLTLDELLAKKEDVAPYILREVSGKATELGVAVNTAGIRDIILPGEVKEIMNRVLIAEKTAQANTITRREETASTRSLLNTAKLMEQNEMLFKLKEMEYVEKIADKINSISLSGGGQLVDQLRQIFSTDKA